MAKTATISLVGLMAGTALVMSACGGPEAADPATAQQKVTASIPAIADNVERAFKGIEKSPALENLGKSAGVVDGLAGGRVQQYRRRFLRDGIEETTPGAAIEKLLNETVFTAANYEGDGVYRLHGNDFCPQPAPFVDPDERAKCISDFDAIEVRVRAETAGETFSATLLIGPERAAPVFASLRTDSVTLGADLAEAKRALDHIATVVEHFGPIPTIMEGSALVSLVVNGDADVTIKAAILDAVRLEGSLGDDLGTASLSAAAKDPLIAVRAQSTEKKLSVDLDIGELVVSLPWGALDEDAGDLAKKILAVDAKGLSASVVLDDAAESLRVTNIGLGDGTSTVKLDGATLVALDLNAAAGRRFALTVTPVEDGQPKLAFDPELDLSLGLFLAPLADAGKDIESFLLDETYRLHFDGTTPTAAPFGGEDDDGDGGIEILSGSLAISSTAATESVVVNAGQCLVGDDEVAEGEHPLLGHLAVVDCR